MIFDMRPAIIFFAIVAALIGLAAGSCWERRPAKQRNEILCDRLEPGRVTCAITIDGTTRLLTFDAGAAQ